MKTKGYIISRLYSGERRLVFQTLSHRKSDAIQDYLDLYAGNTTWLQYWRQHYGHRSIQARVHKVTEIKVAG